MTNRNRNTEITLITLTDQVAELIGNGRPVHANLAEQIDRLEKKLDKAWDATNRCWKARTKTDVWNETKGCWEQV